MKKLNLKFLATLLAAVLTACGGGSVEAGIETPPFNAPASYRLASKLLFSSTAPVISTGWGTSPSVLSNNGSVTFRVNVGSGGVASDGNIQLAVAPSGWNCMVESINSTNNNARTVVYATTTQYVTVQNISISTSTPTPWPPGSVLAFICVPF